MVHLRPPFCFYVKFPLHHGFFFFLSFSFYLFSFLVTLLSSQARSLPLDFSFTLASLPHPRQPPSAQPLPHVHHRRTFSLRVSLSMSLSHISFLSPHTLSRGRPLLLGGQVFVLLLKNQPTLGEFPPLKLKAGSIFIIVVIEIYGYLDLLVFVRVEG